MFDELLENFDEYAPYLAAGLTAGLLLKKVVDELKDGSIQLDMNDEGQGWRLRRKPVR